MHALAFRRRCKRLLARCKEETNLFMFDILNFFSFLHSCNNNFTNVRHLPSGLHWNATCASLRRAALQRRCGKRRRRRVVVAIRRWRVIIHFFIFFILCICFFLLVSKNFIVICILCDDLLSHTLSFHSLTHSLTHSLCITKCSVVGASGRALRVRRIAPFDSATQLGQGDDANAMISTAWRLVTPPNGAQRRRRHVAPMPSRVASIACSLGQTVAPGAVLYELESMKMRTTVRALDRGRVVRVDAVVGQVVPAGGLVVELELDEQK